MKILLFIFLLFISRTSFSQYIGVKAKYTQSRLVDNLPEPPSRENRLVLSFYEVNAAGFYTPVSLSNFDIWVYKQGLQYGSLMGGVLDSTGNNYPGYAWTAPQAVAYYNSYNPNYIDCDPNLATRYTVNGHELDCGFIGVSSWEAGNESFTAPNICLPYYFYPHPYSFSPGNVNFSWPLVPTEPYNWYSFSCSGSTQQVIIRGVLAPGTAGEEIPLPVRFANLRGSIIGTEDVSISWSNLTESNILIYEIERSLDGNVFQSVSTVLPTLNNEGKADYVLAIAQPAVSAYYRIKAVETNNKVFYSTVLLMKKSERNNDPATNPNLLLSIFPNPVNNSELTFRVKDAVEGRYIFFIINPEGQTIKSKIIAHSGGELIRKVDLSGCPKGIYQLVLRSDTKKYIQKFAYVH